MWHKPGTDILDIGANIGYNTLLFSDYGPVISFEPVFHQLVTKNAENNPLRFPVSVCQCALSDKKEKTTMYIPSSECANVINYGGTSLHPYAGGVVTEVNVQCEKLDDIYNGVPSLIKIDVEGHELQVLKGATDTIKNHRPTIIIEIINFTEDNEVHQYLKTLGYITPPTKRPEAMFLYPHPVELHPMS